MAEVVSRLLAGVLALFSMPGNAWAQVSGGEFDFDKLPVLKAAPDFNGVDPASGTYPTASPFALSAPGASHLSSRTSFNGRRQSTTLNVYLDDTTYHAWPGDVSERHIRVHVGGVDALFTCLHVPGPHGAPNFDNVVCSQVVKVDGARLEVNATTGDYVFTDKRGTIYRFFPLVYDFVPFASPCTNFETGCNAAEYSAYAYASEIVYSSGEKLTFEPFAIFNGTAQPRHLTHSVRSNLGYRIEFRTYLASSQTYVPSTVAGSEWLSFRNWQPSEKSLYRGTELIQKLTTTSFVGPSDYRGHEFDMVETDVLGREYQVTFRTSQSYGCNTEGDVPARLATVPILVRSPGGVTTSLEYEHIEDPEHPWYGRLLMRRDSSTPLRTLTRGGQAWTYSDSGGVIQGRVRDVTYQGAFKRSVEYRVQTPYLYGLQDSPDCPLGVVGYSVYASQDELNRRTEYGYAAGRLDWARLPEKNGYDYNYDARGNITEIWRLRKLVGEGQDTLVFRAGYPETCVYPKSCNKPLWVQDAEGIINGYRTDYTYYDTTHGGVDTVTLPELDGVRPQTRHYYTQFDTGDGVIFRETNTSTCIRGSTCEGTEDEAKTVTTYWGNTFLPKIKTISSGTGSVVATVTFDYDSAGRVKVETDALSQQTHYFYDASGRAIGEIGPDPDGAGPLHHLAKRTTYNDDDQVTRLENGTTTAATGVALSAMTVTNQTDTRYDAVGRKILETASADGSTQAITQYSYDAWNRPVCTAVRMSLNLDLLSPPDPCEATLGPDGYDRITKNDYDAAGQLKAVRRAVDTPLEQVYTEYGYSDNGKPQLITDANANLTELKYDEFDRLIATYFPSKRTASRSASQEDYEEYDYDENDNRNWFRRRDGVVLTYDYNKLNLLEEKHIPARADLASSHTPSVSYQYDLRGKLEKALFTSSGQGVEQEYDALGHPKFSKITLDGSNRTLTYAHNAKLRTGVTHPDNITFTYEYDHADRLRTIIHPAAGTLADLTYDAKGRPDVLSGGVTTSYDFDGIGRPTSLVHDLAGTVYDNTYGYQYNPASQLKKVTASNGRFALAATPRNETYQVNGLNQYTSVSGVQQAYDQSGNLTSDGQNTYAYDQENRLVKATTTSSGALKAELWYDPLGRLYKLQSPSATTYFLYDGDELVAEYDSASSAVTQRYVHGAAVDDPVAWFQGPAVSAGARRHLRANHQGSIVAVADATGAELHLPRYDTWGKPLGSHLIRFGYTGQAWIPELGIWHYKARMYSPQFGRFLQTDPVGYEDQLNLYAYVANDPMNHTDPSGQLGEGDSMDRFLRTGEKWSDPSFVKGAAAGAAVGVVAGVAAVGGAIESGAAALIEQGAASANALARAAAAGVSGLIAAARNLAEAPASPATAARSAAPLASVLEGHAAGQGFSGVFEAATGRLLLRPSTAGAVPAGWVARAGGHAAVSAELGGNVATHAGFATIIQQDGSLAVTWLSRTLNAGPGALVPPEIRPAIVQALEAATARTVSAW